MGAGPPVACPLAVPDGITREFPDCRILHAFCRPRDVIDGRQHNGTGEVIQLVAHQT